NQLTNTNDLKKDQTIYLPKRVNDFIISDIDHYTYDKMQNDLKQLQQLYPFIFTQTIGYSVMGKKLVEVQIGSGDKKTHLNGSFHANEWITTSVIMKFVNEYALSLTNNKQVKGISTLPLFQDTTLSLVPMVNPDGVNLVLKGSSESGKYKKEVLAMNKQSENFSNWKANIRGVDLNKQYPANWGMEAKRKPASPAPRDFPGIKPLTEPEAITMANLAKERNFARINAFHTQGEEIYWGFKGFEPSISKRIAGEYARVSGYKPIGELDNYAGYKDWFGKKFQKPGFTIELGKGVNPLPIKQFSAIYERNVGIILANLYL